jgi:colanic acid biosynthesis protein WcaH
MMLDQDTFIAVIRHTPLVAIDLIVTRDDGCILLGHRLNEPARDFWFVPGGRIYKDETMAAAFSRICRDEIGYKGILTTANLLGCYEHFYPENFAGESGISTHYVVLAYRLTLAVEIEQLPARQHDAYRWFRPSEITDNPAIHEHTRAYFMP